MFFSVSVDAAVAIEIFSDPGDYYRRNTTIDDVSTYISDRKKSTPKLPQNRKGMACSDILLIFWGSTMFACRLLDDLCQQYDNRPGC